MVVCCFSKMIFCTLLILFVQGSLADKVHSCENRRLNLACPEGTVISILAANYGRTTKNLCPGGPIQTTSCIAPKSLEIVKAKCEGKSECELQASNGIFSDPCSGTTKYLEVSYNCASEAQTDLGLSCEGNALELSCPKNSVLSIVSANYGRDSGDECATGPIRTTQCYSSSSLNIVKKSCEGREHCQVVASNNVFGDPCRGTYKYLWVEYKCVEKLPSVSIYSCEHGALQLRCPANSEIYVNSANYGRTDRDTCSGGPIQTTECYEPSTVETIFRLCEGHSTCRVEATNEVFGDPCEGTYKYLSVNYHCLKNGVPVAPIKPGATRPPTSGGQGPSAVRPTKKPIAPTSPPTSGSSCKKSQTLIAGKNQCSGQVLFNDNFQSGFDNNKWTHCVFMPWIPDYEFVSFSKNPENCFVEDGSLHIKPTLKSEDEVLRGKFQLRDCTGERYGEECERQAISYNIIPPVSSARIHTKDTFTFRYGIVEIRAKLPVGDWIVPELWLEPVRRAYGPDYASGRIRIAMARGNRELTNPENAEVGCNRLECGVLVGSGDEVRELSLRRERPDGWHDGFHNYTLIWTPDNLIFQVDGEDRKELIPKDGRTMCDLMGFTGESANTWKGGSPLAPCDKDFYISLGLSVGGIRDFPDQSQSGQNPKPWKNSEVKALAKFWKAKDKWYPTWDDSDSRLVVDYVKVKAL